MRPFIKSALKIFGLFALIPLVFIMFMAAATVCSWVVKMMLDRPIDNGGIITGALLGSATSGGYLFLFFFSWWPKMRRVILGCSGLIFLGTVAYSVNYSGAAPFAYVGTTPNDLENYLRSPDPMPVVFFELQRETRPTHLATVERDQTFYITSHPGQTIEFSAATPAQDDARVRLMVDAIGPGSLFTPVFQSPLLASRSWNEYHFNLPKMGPAASGFRIRVQEERDQAAPSSWVFITEPRVVSPPPGPNVVLVCVDTFRADHFNRRTSPFLSGLAEKGVLFTQAQATSSWTLPTVATLMTGLLPHEHGVISQANYRFTGVETLPQQLHRAGYLTVGISTNILLNPLMGMAFKFDRFMAIGREQKNCLNSGRVLTLRAQEVMSSIKDRPFFLYLHYMDPHYPYLAPWPDTFLPPKKGLWFRLRSLYAFFRYDGALKKEWLPLHPDYTPGVIERYDGEIRYWDRQLESLIEFLDQEGLLRNTVVIITADHGEGFGEHGNYQHAVTLNQEEIHVPLLIFDGRRDRGLTVSAPFSLQELPTIIAELTGVPPLPAWTGRKLSDFEGGTEDGNRPVAAELRSYGYAHLPEKKGLPDVFLEARQGAAKIIIHYDPAIGGKTLQLYHLDSDPQERQNLGPEFTGPDLSLLEWMGQNLPDPQSLCVPDPHANTKQQLDDIRALGYIK